MFEFELLALDHHKCPWVSFTAISVPLVNITSHRLKSPLAALVLTFRKEQISIPQICRIFTNKHNNRNLLFSRCDRTPV